jgi:hypothetical protein
MDDAPNADQEWLKKETQIAYDKWLKEMRADWYQLVYNEVYSDMMEDQFMEEYLISKYENKNE